MRFGMTHAGYTEELVVRFGMAGIWGAGPPRKHERLRTAIPAGEAMIRCCRRRLPRVLEHR